jgi:hypothetical protein
MVLGKTLQPGDDVIVMSRRTGKFCRMEAPTAKKIFVKCDQHSPLGAAVMSFTGTSFTHQVCEAAG